jgi:glutathione S-transferase
MSYRLHYFPESGNSYKLALMLTLCGKRWEPVWTDFGGGVTRTPEWRATVNEMGEIPVLEEDGVRLTQTAPILLRLAERSGRFLGTDEDERFKILRWLFWDNHKLTGYIDIQVQSDIHAVSGLAGAWFSSESTDRLPRKPRETLKGSSLRRRRRADCRRHIDGRLSIFS